MTYLNSEDTSKSPISWWKNGRTKGWWDKYPQIQLGIGQLGEREGEIVYKSKGGATGKGIQ